MTNFTFTKKPTTKNFIKYALLCRTTTVACNRSAWSRGVTKYVEDLLDNDFAEYYSFDDICNARLLEKALLNGATNWREFSFGGCSLIYGYDIAERLCTPSELKKTEHGDKYPNSRETWLDVQARALYQAYNAIRVLHSAYIKNYQEV